MKEGLVKWKKSHVRHTIYEAFRELPLGQDLGEDAEELIVGVQ